MEKWQNQRAWFLVMPVVLLVAFNALIPLMTVVNYSVQDIFDSTHRLFVGTMTTSSASTRAIPTRET